MREALNAAKLDHPNIIPVLETDDSMGVPSIVYHFCDGPTLSNGGRTTRAPSLPRSSPPSACTLAEAVQHAHSRGILHRDLKPSNILLEACPRESIHGFPDNDAAWVPRITDFGISKAIDVQESETLTGALMGLPNTCPLNNLPAASRRRNSLRCLFTRCDALRTDNRQQTLSWPSIHRTADADPEKRTSHVPQDSRRHPQRPGSDHPPLLILRRTPTILFGGRLGRRPSIVPGQSTGGGSSTLASRQWYRWAKRQPLTATLILCCLVLLTTAALLGWSHFRQTSHLVAELQKSNTAILKSRSQADQARDRATAIADEYRRTLYTTDMVDAFQALRDRDLPTYHSLLQKQLLGDDQDSRDSVWYYLWSQGHRKATQELATTKNLYSLRLFP